MSLPPTLPPGSEELAAPRVNTERSLAKPGQARPSLAERSGLGLTARRGAALGCWLSPAGVDPEGWRGTEYLEKT